MRIQKLLPCLFVIASLLPVCAFADVALSGQLAAGFPSSNLNNVSSPSLMTGAQLTFGTFGFDWGFAYEHNFLNYKNGGGNGTLNFYGGVVRIETLTNLFVDGQAGVDEQDSDGTSFSWGVGAGYEIPLTLGLDLSPRVGYRAVPTNGVEQSMIDVGVLLTLKLL